MAKIVSYLPKDLPDRKLGYRKALTSKNALLESQGQLNLFLHPDEKVGRLRLRRITPHLSPFEEALMLDEKGDPKAESRYLEAIDQASATADALCNLGVLYASRGDTAKSIGALTKALSLNPRHVESHYNLANVYFDASNYDLAIIHYEVALEIDAQFSDAWFNLSLAYLSLKNHTKSFDAFLQFKKLKPEEGSELDNLFKS